MNHQLVITGPTDKVLNWLDSDTCVRFAVRSWLRLLKDSPVPFFYANDKDRELSIQSLCFQVPLIRRKRLGKLDNSEDPVVRAYCKRHEWEIWSKGQTNLLRWEVPYSQFGYSSTLVMAWYTVLIATVDRRGLPSHHDFGKIHRWVTNGSSLMTGKEIYLQNKFKPISKWTLQFKNKIKKMYEFKSIFSTYLKINFLFHERHSLC